MPTIHINPTLCTNCTYCTQVCPWNIFQTNKNQTTPTITNESVCVSCGQCLLICPTNAILHSNISQQHIKPINKKQIPTHKQLLELLRTRRSTRTFKNKPVEKKLIQHIIDASRYSPSTNNIQNTEFTVVYQPQLLNQITTTTLQHLIKIKQHLQNPFLKKLYCILHNRNQHNINQLITEYTTVIDHTKNGKDLIRHNAPILLFLHADKKIHFAEINTSLALQNAQLMTYALGLGSFIAGYILLAAQEKNTIKQLVSIPHNHQIFGCLAIGHPKLNHTAWIEKKSPKTTWK